MEHQQLQPQTVVMAAVEDQAVMLEDFYRLDLKIQVHSKCSIARMVRKNLKLT